MSDTVPRPIQSHSLRTGAKLRSYRIERMLGEGGFGITYLARHETLDSKVVAIKEYFPQEFATRNQNGSVSPDAAEHEEDFDQGLKRFLREAQHLSSLKEHDHPSLDNVVKVEDVFQHHGTAYMVMEFIDGDPLMSLIDTMERTKKSLSNDRLRRVFLQLGRAIHFVHEKGLLHRDITPANVLIRRNDDEPVLIDFGAAKRRPGFAQAEAASPTITHFTRLVFTPGYSPLEQIDGVEQDRRTDIYSLAATMYHLALRLAPVDAAMRRDTLNVDRDDPLPAAAGAPAARKYDSVLLSCIDEGLRLPIEERPRT
ncbi:MAG: serine/threonine-protein kinase, partial [Pseudomonadota bacterium]